MTYYAVRCPCGFTDCNDWHVSGVARTQGVSFTEQQARSVAYLLNQMEDGDVDNNVASVRVDGQEYVPLKGGE